MRAQTVELTLVDGSVVFMDTTELEVGGVPTRADSVVGNYVSGSRGILMRTNTMADGSGDEYFINPRHIVKMKVSYT